MWQATLLLPRQTTHFRLTPENRWVIRRFEAPSPPSKPLPVDAELLLDGDQLFLRGFETALCTRCMTGITASLRSDRSLRNLPRFERQKFPLQEERVTIDVEPPFKIDVIATEYVVRGASTYHALCKHFIAVQYTNFADQGIQSTGMGSRLQYTSGDLVCWGVSRLYNNSNQCATIPGDLQWLHPLWIWVDTCFRPDLNSFRYLWSSLLHLLVFRAAALHLHWRLQLVAGIKTVSSINWWVCVLQRLSAVSLLWQFSCRGVHLGHRLKLLDGTCWCLQPDNSSSTR